MWENSHSSELHMSICVSMWDDTKLIDYPKIFFIINIKKSEMRQTWQMFSRARNPSLFCNRFSPLFLLYPSRSENTPRRIFCKGHELCCCCCCCLSIINIKWIVIKRKADPENFYTHSVSEYKARGNLWAKKRIEIYEKSHTHHRALSHSRYSFASWLFT